MKLDSHKPTGNRGYKGCLGDREETKEMGEILSPLGPRLWAWKQLNSTMPLNIAEILLVSGELPKCKSVTKTKGKTIKVIEREKVHDQ